MARNTFWENGQFLKNSKIYNFLQNYCFNFVFWYLQINRMASPQILRAFTSCYHICSTNDLSFVIGCCQVIFLVLIFKHLVTILSSVDIGSFSISFWHFITNFWNFITQFLAVYHSFLEVYYSVFGSFPVSFCQFLTNFFLHFLTQVIAVSHSVF